MCETPPSADIVENEKKYTHTSRGFKKCRHTSRVFFLKKIEKDKKR
jgi:hypothetical protein